MADSNSAGVTVRVAAPCPAAGQEGEGRAWETAGALAGESAAARPGASRMEKVNSRIEFFFVMTTPFSCSRWVENCARPGRSALHSLAKGSSGSGAPGDQPRGRRQPKGVQTGFSASSPSLGRRGRGSSRQVRRREHAGQENGGKANSRRGWHLLQHLQGTHLQGTSQLLPPVTFRSSRSTYLQQRQ